MFSLQLTRAIKITLSNNLLKYLERNTKTSLDQMCLQTLIKLNKSKEGTFAFSA